MTRKDYQMIAKVIANTVEMTKRGKYDGLSNPAGFALCDVASDLAYEMADDNAHFDRAKFMTACGLEGK